MNSQKFLIINEERITFEDIYKKYYHHMLAYFLKRIENPSDAEDLVSEVFLYCYRNFDTYDSAKASVSTWLYLIAKSRYLNYCRRKKLTENIDDFGDTIFDSCTSIEDAACIEELRNALNSALCNLSERQRSIVVLKYFDDMTTEEIAGIYRTSPNNIRVQLHKALKNLKKYISDWS